MAWYDDDGNVDNCVAAYDAIGASSLSDSYTDESGNGNDAAPGTAPTWASGTGWTLNGSTQYLTTGIEPTGAGYTVAVRFSGAAGTVIECVLGAGRSSDGDAMSLFPRDTTDDNRHVYGDAALAQGVRLASGVMVLAGSVAYVDGASVGDTGGTYAPSVQDATLYIGCRNNRGTAVNFFGGNVQCVAIYSDTLTAQKVSDITDNMNALPNYSEGSPVVMAMQQHHHAAVYGGVAVG